MFSINLTVQHTRTHVQQQPQTPAAQCLSQSKQTPVRDRGLMGAAGSVEYANLKNASLCATQTQAYAYQVQAYDAQDRRETRVNFSLSTALRIAAIQARLATIQQHQRLGIALAAHRGAGREGAGGFFGWVGLRGGGGIFAGVLTDHRAAHFADGAYFRVFFCALALEGGALLGDQLLLRVGEF